MWLERWKSVPGPGSDKIVVEDSDMLQCEMEMMGRMKSHLTVLFARPFPEQVYLGRR